MAPRLSPNQREQIIALRLSGCRVADISRQTGITIKTVRLWLKRWEQSGSLEAHHRQLYKRSTSEAEDAAIVAAHSADPSLSTRVSSTTYSISTDTVRRRLKEARKKSAAKASRAKKEPKPLTCPNCNTVLPESLQATSRVDLVRSMIAKVFHFLEQEYMDLMTMYPLVDLTPLTGFSARAAAATGVTENTVLEILNEEAERFAATGKPAPKRPRTTRKRREPHAYIHAVPNSENNPLREFETETLVIKQEPADITDYLMIETNVPEIKQEPQDEPDSQDNGQFIVGETSAAESNMNHNTETSTNRDPLMLQIEVEIEENGSRKKKRNK